MSRENIEDLSPEELQARFTDPLWRLDNLYSIKDAETGQIIPFHPRPEQKQIFAAVYEDKETGIIILKARRLGMSTGIDVLLADATIFNAGIQSSIIDRTQGDAALKLNNIVKMAFESLDDELKKRFKIHKTNDSSFVISLPGDAPSAIYAGTNARGGTNQFLHVSEWGVIQADDPKRSEEILTGAIPSAQHGTVIIETTWKGGRGGDLWKLVEQAMKGKGKYKLFFFPWWTDETYTREGDASEIEPEIAQYLLEKEKEIGITFSAGQKLWYQEARQTFGLFTYREFPTTISECFMSPIDGAIYADLIDALREKGRIGNGFVDQSALVHTFWDLGSPINTVVWYVQLVGQEIRVIDCDMNQDLTVTQRVSRILGKGYNFGWHYLPHDAASTHATGRTIQQELTNAGLKNTRIIPRTHDVWIGINRLRQLMPRMFFHMPECEDGVEALSNYHTKRESTSGTVLDVPVHDWTSHASDALRMLAEAEMNNMLEGGSTIAKRGKRGGARVMMGVGNSLQAIRGKRQKTVFDDLL